MLGNRQVIDVLNVVLGHQLVSIHRYFLHGKMLKNWGYGRLAEQELNFSRIEMKQAAALMDRILFLQAIPEARDVGYMRIGENTPEILTSDLQHTESGRPGLRQGIATAEQLADHISRDLLEAFLQTLETQIDWQETQLSLINTAGLPNYLQSQMNRNVQHDASSPPSP